MSIEPTQSSFHISPINSSTEITPFREDYNDHTMPKSLPKTNPTTPSLSDPKSDVTPTTTTAANPPAATGSAQKLLQFIKSDLDYIKDTSKKLHNYKTHVEGKVENASIKLKSFESALEIPVEEDPTQPNNNIEQDLRKLKKSVRKLKLPLAASRFNINYAALNKDSNLCFSDPTRGKPGDATNDVNEIMKALNLYSDPLFEHSSAFQDFNARFQELEKIESRLCLLCFSIFPEGAIIKKRLMIYWWIAEGFVKAEGENSTAEQVGCEFFNELIKKGFIKPVNEKRWRMEEVGSCKIDPLTRFGLIKLADRAKMFDFDTKGNLKADFSYSCRACLLGEGLVNIPDLYKIHMLFNVDENFLEFNQGWFSKMRNAHIVYLGRWKASGKHHIEVEDVGFLEELEHLKHLKFLSFQGVSRITELPESMSKLINLIILDLRACHNLESVPRGIGALKNLTHLDMWECYLLDYMPKQLSLLENLQVLKGFVIGDSKGKTSCTLDDLAKLEKLKKLSILAKVKDFPEEQDLIALSQFNALCKLTIAWGGGSTKPTRPPPLAPRRSKQLTRRGNLVREELEGTVFPMLPENLEKLDLQCYPEEFAPGWLKSHKLKRLKKLYIRGGKLRYLHVRHEKNVEDEWINVQTLCLKYLSDLEMDWKELCKLFPNVIYLEKVKCPKLTLFPCDQFGVWMKKKNNGK